MRHLPRLEFRYLMTFQLSGTHRFDQALIGIRGILCLNLGSGGDCGELQDLEMTLWHCGGGQQKVEPSLTHTTPCLKIPLKLYSVHRRVTQYCILLAAHPEALRGNKSGTPLTVSRSYSQASRLLGAPNDKACVGAQGISMGYVYDPNGSLNLLPYHKPQEPLMRIRSLSLSAFGNSRC